QKNRGALRPIFLWLCCRHYFFRPSVLLLLCLGLRSTFFAGLVLTPVVFSARCSARCSISATGVLGGRCISAGWSVVVRRMPFSSIAIRRSFSNLPMAILNVRLLT